MALNAVAVYRSRGVEGVASLGGDDDLDHASVVPVAALTGEAGAVEGESFVLTGPASIGFADVAHVLSEVVGRNVEYVPVPHATASEALLGMGVPEWIVQGYAELSTGFANGFADMTTENVKKLSGHEPRDFAQFARDFAPAFSDARAPVG